MAIFHYHISVGSLKSGGAQQRGRYVRRDPRQPADETHDVSSFTLNMPKWTDGDPDIFWETVDAMERKGGLVYREHELALPNELTREQNEALAREFAIQEFSKFVVEAGFHWKPENGHVHIQTCEREQDDIERDRSIFFKRYNSKNPEKGGCKKSIRFSGGELSDRAQQKRNVEAIREAWAQMTNQHLARHGHLASIDHRSNEARGIHEPASVHMGKKALGMEKRGIVSHRRSFAIEIEKRRQYVISKRLSEIAERDRVSHQQELDQRNSQTNKGGAGPILKVAEQRVEDKRSTTPTGFSHVEKLGNRGAGWVDTVPNSIGLARVHQTGFDYPAYFSSARPRGSSPVAIAKKNGFIAVPDIRLSDQELDAIITLGANSGTRIEAMGSKDWCKRVEGRAKALQIEVKHQFQVSDQEKKEFDKRWEAQQREERSLQKPGYRPSGM
jgi:hypothetical protein